MTTTGRSWTGFPLTSPVSGKRYPADCCAAVGGFGSPLPWGWVTAAAEPASTPGGAASGLLAAQPADAVSRLAASASSRPLRSLLLAAALRRVRIIMFFTSCPLSTNLYSIKCNNRILFSRSSSYYPFTKDP
ncbi:hypothetical protein [Paenibacillus sp. RC67]|uniref:hypothetical protein n=1 Tax=Paenibacillus sp. RC67 TaxID=3039392 RepID=UPI0024ADECF9|nr:hypothetical protein [Paenibacillus sp. RC67]